MKWGILATGTIAKKFADTIRQMGAEGESLAAVGSRRAESAQAFAAAYGIPKWYDSYEQLVQDPEVEAVYIATPNSLHADNCRLCLEHGKHVLCEKPFTLRAEQAQQLYQLAARKHLFLMEALWTRLLPLYQDLQALLAAGELGAVQTVSCQYGFVARGARRDRKFDSRLGGGALLDIGIYNLGFLQMVTGQQPDAVATQQLTLSPEGTDAYSRLLLRYPSGCVALSTQAIGQELTRNAWITCERGSIFVPDFQHAARMVVLREGESPEMVRCPFEYNGFEYQIREASRCVRAGESASRIYTPRHSLALAQLMDQIRDSWGMRFEGEP